MQEVEAKRKLTPADGAHIFYTAIFLTAATIVKTSYETSCGTKSSSIDLGLFVDLLFYGLLLWATFLIISLLPRYKNENLRTFLNLMDLLYGFYHIALVIYAGLNFYSDNAAECVDNAPQAHFLAELYIYITGATAAIVTVGFTLWIFRKFFKHTNAGFINQTDYV